MTIHEVPSARDGAVDWVTKTNVTDHARCPRAWWLIAHGKISHEDAISPHDLANVEAGVEFERDIVDCARPLDPGELAAGVEVSAAGQFPLVLQTGLWTNHDLGLRGEPDGIEIASGAWAPVEVKHHSRATPLDRLELAFYWMLLEPQREVSPPSPHGYLILGGPDGPFEPVRIDLQPSHFAKVRQHIDAVRLARIGSEPPGCGRCHVCRRLRPPIAMSYDDWSNDLGALFGLGYNRALQLAMVGIKTSTDLLDAGVEDILDRIHGRRWSIGRYQVDGWFAHAHAWAANQPVIYGDPRPMPEDYTTFDLEYLRQGEIWLAGMQPSDGALTQIWAWTADEETDLMRKVNDYWTARPGALMATWWGKGADLPALKRATERTGVAFDLSSVSHFDLFHWAMGHLRLPVRGLSLKNIASYFGLSDATHGISAGDEAVEIYLRARAQRSKADRGRARAMLEAYNADDLASLAKLIETLRGMYPQTSTSRQGQRPTPTKVNQRVTAEPNNHDRARRRGRSAGMDG